MSKGVPNGRIRVVVDECSFDFRTVTDQVAETMIDDFNDALYSLLYAGEQVGVCSLYHYVEVRSGVPLATLLYETATAISRDTRLLCGRLLDRCLHWDELAAAVNSPPDVLIDGVSVTAYSVGFALVAGHGRFMSCLTCGSVRQGLREVSAGGRSGKILFVAKEADLPLLWESILSSEEVDETEFFRLSELAFPALYFHPDLRFGAFRGSYSEVYGWVVKALSALNRDFSRSCAVRKGVRHEIEADMRSQGVEVSPESPQTHANAQAMRQRDVVLDGVTYRCEWHAKRTWSTDRIHFSLPGALPDGRILVGIFTDHLGT